MNLAPQTQAAICRDIKDGYSLSAIARRRKVPINDVRAMVPKRARITRHPKGGLAPEYHRAANKMLREGCSYDVVIANFPGAILDVPV